MEIEFLGSNQENVEIYMGNLWGTYGTLGVPTDFVSLQWPHKGRFQTTSKPPLFEKPGEIWEGTRKKWGMGENNGILWTSYRSNQCQQKVEKNMGGNPGTMINSRFSTVCYFEAKNNGQLVSTFRFSPTKLGIWREKMQLCPIPKTMPMYWLWELR